MNRSRVRRAARDIVSPLDFWPVSGGRYLGDFITLTVAMRFRLNGKAGKFRISLNEAIADSRARLLSVRLIKDSSHISLDCSRQQSVNPPSKHPAMLSYWNIHSICHRHIPTAPILKTIEGHFAAESTDSSSSVIV